MYVAIDSLHSDAYYLIHKVYTKGAKQMNPYQIMGVIAVCASLFAGVVALLSMQGMPVLAAFICVYVVAIWFMLSLQRRARQAEGSNFSQQRVSDRGFHSWPLTVSTNTNAVPEQRRSNRRFGS